VKVALRSVPDAFEALLQLLNSEYPVIQHQALLALIHATENGRFIPRLSLSEISPVTSNQFYVASYRHVIVPARTEDS